MDAKEEATMQQMFDEVSTSEPESETDFNSADDVLDPNYELDRDENFSDSENSIQGDNDTENESSHEDPDTMADDADDEEWRDTIADVLVFQYDRSFSGIKN